jgi:hypothetical protein
VCNVLQGSSGSCPLGLLLEADTLPNTDSKWKARCMRHTGSFTFSLYTKRSIAFPSKPANNGPASGASCPVLLSERSVHIIRFPIALVLLEYHFLKATTCPLLQVFSPCPSRIHPIVCLALFAVYLAPQTRDPSLIQYHPSRSCLSRTADMLTYDFCTLR